MRPEDLRIVDGPVLVRDCTLNKLRSAITTGLYPPGAPLIERELCEALGVSRTSVREALRQLQSEKLVETGPSRNMQVAVINAQDAEDIYQLREMIETLAIRQFVMLADRAALKRLEATYKNMRRSISKNDLPQIAAIADDFYAIILEGGGSRVIKEVASQLMARVTYLRFRTMAEPGRLEDGLHEWDKLMHAIRSKDADAAAQAMAEHMRRAREAIVQRLKDDEDDQRKKQRLAG